MVMETLQKDTQTLEAWQDCWKMSFNPTKCSIMEISLKNKPPHTDYNFCGQVLHQASSHPYLGIQLDSKLSWNEDVSSTVKKANRTLGFIKRNLWFCPKEVKGNRIYNTGASCPELCILCLGPIKRVKINKLESVQRKAARFCVGNYRRDSSVNASRPWLGLASKYRERNRLTMFYKILNEMVGINREEHIKISSAAGKRRNLCQHVEIPFSRKEVYRNSFFPRTSRAWNGLNNQVVSKSIIEEFKKIF